MTAEPSVRGTGAPAAAAGHAGRIFGSVAFDFLFDPLCGWCYGAAPTIQRLRAAFPCGFSPRPIGLFYRESVRPMDAGIARYIRQADRRIHELTGQPFAAAYFERLVAESGPRLDSTPAIRAILAADSARPGQGLDLLEALQRARFTAGRDITDPTIIAAIAAESGLQGGGSGIDDAELTGRISESRRLLEQFGMDGVPGLILRGLGDWQGQLRQVLPNRLLHQPDAAVAFVAERLAALGS